MDHNQPNWEASSHRLKSARAGPPQIIALDFHPNEEMIWRSLRHEMKSAGLFFPFITTVSGFRSNSGTVGAVGEGGVSTAVLGEVSDCDACTGIGW